MSRASLKRLGRCVAGACVQQLVVIVQLLPVESAVASVRQGAGLSRLRDEMGEAQAVIQVADLEAYGIAADGLTREVVDTNKAAPYRAELHQVLLSQFTSNLRVALVDEEVTKHDAIVGTNISIITPNPDVATPEYLLALFSSQAFHARMERLTGGSTLAQLSVSALKRLEIPVPPRERQEQLGRAFRHAAAAARAAKRIVEAQSTLLEHAALDLWEEARQDA